MAAPLHPMAADEPIGVTLLTGYLGAGKTTLLNRLLAAPHGLKVAVIVNEFGSVGVDGALVPSGTRFVELDNGCLCCQLNEDLDQTLRELAARGGFGHLIIETTGAADPLPVAWTFTRPGLSKVYRVDAIVTVLDALNGPASLASASEAQRQVSRADLLVMSKLDCVDDGGAAAVAAAGRLNQIAPVLPLSADELPWSMLLSRLRAADATLPQNGAGAEQGGGDGAGHTGGGHDSTLPGHLAGLQTYSFVAPGVIDDAALEDLVFGLPASVWRVKGLLPTNTDWGWTLVNGVGGRIDLRPWRQPPPGKKAGLTFIGHDLDLPALKEACARLPVAGRDALSAGASAPPSDPEEDD